MRVLYVRKRNQNNNFNHLILRRTFARGPRRTHIRVVPQCLHYAVFQHATWICMRRGALVVHAWGQTACGVWHTTPMRKGRCSLMNAHQCLGVKRRICWLKSIFWLLSGFTHRFINIQLNLHFHNVLLYYYHDIYEEASKKALGCLQFFLCVSKTQGGVKTCENIMWVSVKWHFFYFWMNFHFKFFLKCFWLFKA